MIESINNVIFIVSMVMITIMGYFVAQYVVNRTKGVMQNYTTVDNKKIMIERKRRWYEY